MALGDVGQFLPAESHYGTPGAYDKMLQAEAQKRGAYLSAMDQYYENLAESQRQFTETLGFKVETRDLELEWAREKQTKELAFKREELEATKAYQEGMLSLGERQIESTELDFFDKQKMWGMVEREQESREDIREAGMDIYGGGAGGVQYTYGKDQPYNQPQVEAPTSGRVTMPGVLGRQSDDFPNWEVPSFTNIREETYEPYMYE